MKSLQILTPARKCMFNCPFCISKSHEHNNSFTNNYKDNYDLWKNNLIQILNQYNDLKNIVITGTNEPMQNPECVQDIIDLVRTYRSDINVELQTRYYKKMDLYDQLDVVAYSISDFSFLEKIKISNVINRYVIILTDSFNNKSLIDIINKIPNNVSQLTFKYLHDSEGMNKELDNWITNHRVNTQTTISLINEIQKYNGILSVRYDGNCMDATDRYMIFREDGNLYDDWNSKECIM